MSIFKLDLNENRPSSITGKKLIDTGMNQIKQPIPSIQPVKPQQSVNQPIKTEPSVKQPQVLKQQPQQSIPQNNIEKPKYMSGNIIDKALDLVSTPLYGIGSFLTGTRKKAEELAPKVKSGEVGTLSALGQSFLSGVKNIIPGIQQRQTIGDYFKYLGETKSKDIPEPVKGVLRSPITQFAGDVVFDPMTYVSLGSIFKTAGKGLSKVPGLVEGAEKAKTAVKELPFFEALAKRFVKGYGVPEKVVEEIDDISRKFGTAAEEIARKKAGLYKGLTKEQIEAIPAFLEPKGKAAAGAGIDLRALREKLGPDFEKKIRPVLHEERKNLQQLVIDAVKRGEITGEQAKEYLKRGYYPHTNFTREPKTIWEKIKTFITGEKPSLIEKKGGQAKLGTYATYFKERKGVEGFTREAPKATLTRELTQLKNNLVQDALNNIKNQFGVKVGNGIKVPEGYVAFLENTPERLKDLKGYALPKQIAEYITQNFSRYSTSEELRKIEKFVDSFNRLWKPTATYVNIPYHITNMIGNLYNSWLAGMHNPKRLLQAIKGGFSETEKELVRKSGVLQGNQFIGEIAQRTMDDILGGKLPTTKGFLNKLSQAIENNARSALFLDTREKLIKSGMKEIDATKEAVKYVNKHLFDYLNGFTPFENRVMRRILPFYAWSRKNIPLQIEKFITDTGKQVTTLKAARKLRGGKNFGDDEEEGISIPIGKDEEGREIRWKVPLPIQDVFENPLRKAVNMINPLIREGIQLSGYLLGKASSKGGETPVVPVDLYTGKERTKKSFPLRKQVSDITNSLARSLFRPFRSYLNLRSDENETLKTLKFLLPGFYKAPSEQQKAIREAIKNLNLRKDVESAIYDVIYDPYLTEREKAKKIDELLSFYK